MKSAYVHLSQDPVMKTLIERFGPISFPEESTDIFSDIVSTIISQQLSIKAADTIEKRFVSLLKTPYPYVPDEIVSLPDDTIRHSAGLSYAKIKYVKGLSQNVLTGSIDLAKIASLSNDDAIAQLVKLDGIGPWTAEMLLLFTFKRPDVFSVGDAGLRRAMYNLYGVAQESLDEMRRISLQWSPYRSYASRYLWKSLDNSGGT